MERINTRNLKFLSFLRSTYMFLFVSLLFFLIVIRAAGAEERANLSMVPTNRPDPIGKPTTIHVGIYIVDLDAIDGASQTFTANVFLEMEWKDPRLAMTDGDTRTLDLNAVWNPVIELVNQQRVFASQPRVVEVKPDGTVRNRQRVWGQFSYPFNLRDFPLDKHKLQIQVASVEYGTEDLNIVIDKFATGMADVVTVADWHINQWNAHTNTYEPSPGVRPVAGFVFEFEAQRKVGYYIFKVILPLTLVIIMSWIIFWIRPVHIGTKVSVAVTAMLTLIAYRFVLGDLLPRISYLTRMDIFIIGASLLVFGALLESAVAAWLEDKQNGALAIKLDFWSRWVFPLCFVLLIAITLIT